MKKYSFWNWVANNGVMSNLVSGAIVSAIIALIWFVVGKIVDNPAVSAAAAIIAAIVAFIIAWLSFWRSHSGEKFWSCESGFITVPSSRIDNDKFFADKFETGDVRVRQSLQDWIAEWIDSVDDVNGCEIETHGTSKICVISGKQNVGRTSVVVHAALQARKGEGGGGRNCTIFLFGIHLREWCGSFTCS